MGHAPTIAVKIYVLATGNNGGISCTALIRDGHEAALPIGVPIGHMTSKGRRKQSHISAFPMELFLSKLHRRYKKPKDMFFQKKEDVQVWLYVMQEGVFEGVGLHGLCQVIVPAGSGPHVSILEPACAVDVYYCYVDVCPIKKSSIATT